MVRNLVVFGGSSHPRLTEAICNHLGIPPGEILLGKFAVGETRVEVQDSVRGKDVYIVQSAGGLVNDHLMELLIIISACKTASCKKVTVILPLFPYSRQSDLPYNKIGAPLAKAPLRINSAGEYTFDSVPATPKPGQQQSQGVGNSDALNKQLSRIHVDDPQQPNGLSGATSALHNQTRSQRSNTAGSTQSASPQKPNGTSAHTQDTEVTVRTPTFEAQRGYRQWVAQAGTLIANLLTDAGTNHVITLDLHDPQYQGFFDIPVDNLYGRNILKKYVKSIPNYQNAVIVSPDAGGAKRATAIADELGMPFALIHKERRTNPTSTSSGKNQSPAMILVGSVAGRTAILIDDLADTSNTITRAAKLLRREGAHKIYALVTHGVLSGDAIDRINASALDTVVVTNSVDQEEHLRDCPKLEVLDVAPMFAEAIRRVHHGESISVLFQHD